MLYNGVLYLYTSHDDDVTVNNFFTMNDWRFVLHGRHGELDGSRFTRGLEELQLGNGRRLGGSSHPAERQVLSLHAHQQLDRFEDRRAGREQSLGPVHRPARKGADLLEGSGNIDPTVFIDSDGQAYLYWGNPTLYYVKPNTDMISFPGSPTAVSLTTAGFGVRSNTDRATAYEEGPWFYKRGSLYYIVYPADGTPEKISYTTSSSPTGPWTYRGDIMAKESGTGSSFTNHPGVIDYQGHSYFFYHNGALPGGGGYKRSVCIEEFTYNADGTIPTIKMSTTGPAAVATLNPFLQVEAETIAFSAGLKTEVCSEGGMDVTQINNGDYIKVKNVAFGTGATSFDAPGGLEHQRWEHRAASRQPHRHGDRDLRRCGDGGRPDLDHQVLHRHQHHGNARSFPEVHRLGDRRPVQLQLVEVRWSGRRFHRRWRHRRNGNGNRWNRGLGWCDRMGGKGGTAGTGATGSGGAAGSGAISGSGGTGSGGRGGAREAGAAARS